MATALHNYAQSGKFQYLNELRQHYREVRRRLEQGKQKWNKPRLTQIISITCSDDAETKIPIQFIKRAGIPGIQDVVVRHFRLSYLDLLGPRHFKRYAWPRQVGYWLCFRLTGHSLTVIGKFFNRDHSTILCGCRRVQKRYDSDPAFKQEADALAEECLERVVR